MTVTDSVSVTVSRRFDATAERVFDAWLDVLGDLEARL